MHRASKLKLNQLNSNLTCPLCKGYLIDSYTINECLHSFCKSCIIRYVKKKECCPICKIAIMKEKISSFLRRDVNLQCVVYKLVPGLFQREMQRRRDFYTAHPKAIKFLKKRKICDKEALGELDEDELMPGDVHSEFSLSIEYSETGLAEICNSQRQRVLDPTLPPRTYLQCTSGLTVHLLKRFLALKYEAEEVPAHSFEIMYDDKPLGDELTLLDIAYIYAWRRHTAPMRLFYRVKDYKRPVLTLPSSSPIIQEEMADQVSSPLNAMMNTEKPVLSQIDNNKMSEFAPNNKQECDIKSTATHVLSATTNREENVENCEPPIVSTATKPVDQIPAPNVIPPNTTASTSLSTDQQNSTKAAAGIRPLEMSTFNESSSIKENVQHNNTGHDTQPQFNNSLNMSTTSSTVADHGTGPTITSMMANMKQAHQQQQNHLQYQQQLARPHDPSPTNDQSTKLTNGNSNTLPKTKKPPKQKSSENVTGTVRQIKPKKQKTQAGTMMTSSPIVDNCALSNDLTARSSHVPPQTSTPIESMIPGGVGCLKSIKSEPIQPASQSQHYSSNKPSTNNKKNGSSGHTDHHHHQQHQQQQQPAATAAAAMPPPSLLSSQFNPLMPALMNQFWKAATSGASAVADYSNTPTPHHHNPLIHQMQQMQQAAYLTQQQKLFASMFAGAGQSSMPSHSSQHQQQHQPAQQQFGSSSYYNHNTVYGGGDHHSQLGQNYHSMQPSGGGGFQYGFPPHHQMMFHNMYNAAAAAANSNNNNMMSEDIKPAHLASSFQDVLYKTLRQAAAAGAMNHNQTGISLPTFSSSSNNNNNNMSGNTSNCSDSLDSLKETGLKISESCNLVNE